MFGTWVVSILLLLAAFPAWARESTPVVSPRAIVSLASETDTVTPGRSVRLGLRFRLAPGWHIYWSNPGDAGTPPDLALTLPPGAAAGGIVWPTPVRLAQGPVMSFGYTGDVLLPVIVTPTAGSVPMEIQAKASWLVCHHDCIPEEGEFALTLPPGPSEPSAEAPLFTATDARTPVPSPFTATIATDGQLTVSGSGLSPTTVQDAWFLPATWGLVDHSAAQTIEVGHGSLSLALTLGPMFDASSALSGVLVIEDPAGGQSFLALTAAPAGGAMGWTAAGRVLGLALLGGLVLNLMPCVFPILAMKAIALARLAGAARSTVRAHGLGYLAGVLAAFAVLSGLTLAARGTGQAVGWGGHFQSPAFVAATAWLLLAVGLKLSGVFAIGHGLSGVGQGLAEQKGMVGSVFTGLLAVVVATPCTAPFMGAAVAVAITQPAPLLVATFLTLGLGFAAPFVLLAAVPALTHLLPRPGRWIDVLKQALAFPMYAACGWLVWVEGRQTGTHGLAATIGGIVLVGFACWALGAAQAASGWGRRLGGSAAAASVLAALLLLAPLATSPSAAAEDDAPAETFSVARLAALRAEGRPVFVNMTAAWCIVCLVNERLALGTETVRREFTRRGIDYLKGDWTRRNPEITAFLHAHARDGVPLYVFYPAGDAPPAVLPQILTEATVLWEISHAAN